MIVLSLSVIAFVAALAGAAQARSVSGPGRIVYVAGRAEHCKMGACPTYDLIQSISPHGGHRHVLAKIRSVVETASTEDGTVAVLSKNVAGGGANASAFTQVYLITPSGKRQAVFRHRLQGFNATGLGISGDGKLLALSGRYTGGPSDPAKIWVVRTDGTGLRQLTTGPGTDEMPAISPSGKQIVFARTLHDGTPAGRKPELYVVGINGGEPVRLTENAAEDVNPVFSPDGHSIAFGRVAARNHGGVDVIGTDGSGERKIASTEGTYPRPRFLAERQESTSPSTRCAPRAARASSPSGCPSSRMACRSGRRGLRTTFKMTTARMRPSDAARYVPVPVSRVALLRGNRAVNVSLGDRPPRTRAHFESGS